MAGRSPSLAPSPKLKLASARIVVSGGAQFTKRDYLPDAALIGVDATLQKPFEIETLLETLRSLPA